MIVLLWLGSLLTAVNALCGCNYNYNAYVCHGVLDEIDFGNQLCPEMPVAAFVTNDSSLCKLCEYRKTTFLGQRIYIQSARCDCLECCTELNGCSCGKETIWLELASPILYLSPQCRNPYFVEKPVVYNRPITCDGFDSFEQQIDTIDLPSEYDRMIDESEQPATVDPSIWTQDIVSDTAAMGIRTFLSIAAIVVLLSAGYVAGKRVHLACCRILNTPMSPPEWFWLNKKCYLIWFLRRLERELVDILQVFERLQPPPQHKLRRMLFRGPLRMIMARELIVKDHMEEAFDNYIQIYGYDRTAFDLCLRSLLIMQMKEMPKNCRESRMIQKECRDALVKALLASEILHDPDVKERDVAVVLRKGLLPYYCAKAGTQHWSVSHTHGLSRGMMTLLQFIHLASAAANGRLDKKKSYVMEKDIFPNECDTKRSGITALAWRMLNKVQIFSCGVKFSDQPKLLAYMELMTAILNNAVQLNSSNFGEVVLSNKDWSLPYALNALYAVTQKPSVARAVSWLLRMAMTVAVDGPSGHIATNGTALSHRVKKRLFTTRECFQLALQLCEYDFSRKDVAPEIHIFLDKDYDSFDDSCTRTDHTDCLEACLAEPFKSYQLVSDACVCSNGLMELLEASASGNPERLKAATETGVGGESDRLDANCRDAVAFMEQFEGYHERLVHQVRFAGFCLISHPAFGFKPDVQLLSATTHELLASFVSEFTCAKRIKPIDPLEAAFLRMKTISDNVHTMKTGEVVGMHDALLCVAQGFRWLQASVDQNSKRLLPLVAFMCRNETDVLAILISTLWDLVAYWKRNPYVDFASQLEKNAGPRSDRPKQPLERFAALHLQSLDANKEPLFPWSHDWYCDLFTDLTLQVQTECKSDSKFEVGTMFDRRVTDAVDSYYAASRYVASRRSVLVLIMQSMDFEEFVVADEVPFYNNTIEQQSRWQSLDISTFKGPSLVQSMLIHYDQIYVRELVSLVKRPSGRPTIERGGDEDVHHPTIQPPPRPDVCPIGGILHLLPTHPDRPLVKEETGAKVIPALLNMPWYLREIHDFALLANQAELSQEFGIAAGYFQNITECEHFSQLQIYEKLSIYIAGAYCFLRIRKKALENVCSAEFFVRESEHLMSNKSLEPLISVLKADINCHRHQYIVASEILNQLRIENAADSLPLRYPAIDKEIKFTTLDFLNREQARLMEIANNPPQPEAVCRHESCSLPGMYYDFTHKGHAVQVCTEGCSVYFHLECFRSLLASLGLNRKRLREEFRKTYSCFNRSCAGSVSEVAFYDQNAAWKATIPAGLKANSSKTENQVRHEATPESVQESVVGNDEPIDSNIEDESVFSTNDASHETADSGISERFASLTDSEDERDIVFTLGQNHQRREEMVSVFDEDLVPLERKDYEVPYSGSRRRKRLKSSTRRQRSTTYSVDEIQAMPSNMLGRIQAPQRRHHTAMARRETDLEQLLLEYVRDRILSSDTLRYNYPVFFGIIQQQPESLRAMTQLLHSPQSEPIGNQSPASLRLAISYPTATTSWHTEFPDDAQTIPCYPPAPAPATTHDHGYGDSRTGEPHCAKAPNGVSAPECHHESSLALENLPSTLPPCPHVETDSSYKHAPTSVSAKKHSPRLQHGVASISRPISPHVGFHNSVFQRVGRVFQGRYSENQLLNFMAEAVHDGEISLEHPATPAKIAFLLAHYVWDKQPNKICASCIDYICKPIVVATCGHCFHHGCFQIERCPICELNNEAF